MATDGKETIVFPAKNGPFLGAAFIVERVLTEMDKVNSFIRWVDRIGLSSDAEYANPGEIVEIPLTTVISFRSGECKDKMLLGIVQTAPSGDTFPIGVAETQFDPSITNVNVITKTFIKWESPGQYWFDITLNNAFVTRIGLFVDGPTKG